MEKGKTKGQQKHGGSVLLNQHITSLELFFSEVQLAQLDFEV